MKSQNLKVCFSQVLAAVWLLLLPAVARSQSSYYVEDLRKFYGGLVLGGNFTQVDGDRFAGYNKAGLNAGGIVYINFTEHVAASLEILYSQKGARSTEPQLVDKGFYITDYGITLNYAEIPVMINYVDKHKSNVGIGLSYARLGTSKESITTIPSLIYNADDYPFKKSDLNLLLGGNLHLWKGLFLNIRAQYSLISIRDKIPQTYAKAEQFNNMWTVRVMYLFM